MLINIFKRVQSISSKAVTFLTNQRLTYRSEYTLTKHHFTSASHNTGHRPTKTLVKTQEEILKPTQGRYQFHSCSNNLRMENSTSSQENIEKSSQGEEHLEWPAYLDLDTSDSLSQPVECEVEGNVPAWLTGSLFRNGSGVYKMGDTRYKHLFDGFAVISRFTIQDGLVTFFSTILDSKIYKESLECNRLLGVSFGSSFPDPCKNIFRSYFSHYIPTMAKSDNTAVNIIKCGDKLFALTEDTTIHEIDKITLRSKGNFDMQQYLALHIATAHPHMEKDGSMIYFGTNMRNYKKAFNFVCVPPPENGESKETFSKAKIMASVESRWSFNISYTHSFGLTENYIVFLEQPVAFNLRKILTSGVSKSSIEETIINYPDEPICIHLVNRKTGERVPVKYFAPHGFVFHFINCYEEEGHVVCDLCMHENGQAVRKLYLDEILRRQRDKVNLRSTFARFVLPLSVEVEEAESGINMVKLNGSEATAVLRTGKKNEVDLTQDSIFDDSVTFELPRINYDYNEQKYKYAYATTDFNTDVSRLLKLDVESKQVLEWKCPDSHSPGEPVFVKSPDGKNEDDGVIMCPILARSTDHSSFLLILDGKNFKEVARATVPSNIKINFTFHGDFCKGPDFNADSLNRPFELD